MNKKYILILLVVLALTLNACTRSASSIPVASATPAANFPLPATTTGMNAIEIAGTQTAIATMGLPMPTVGVGSAETGSVTPVANASFTPLAGVNQTPAADQATSDASVSTPLPSPTGGIVALNTQVPQTSVPVAKPASYTLHAGEFPYCLARRFNVDPVQLLAVNGLSGNQSYYTPGTVIIIPQTGGAFPGPRSLLAHPTQYIVRAGESIYSIACDFGDVDPMSIASANGLTGSYSLTTGTTIQIP